MSSLPSQSSKLRSQPRSVAQESSRKYNLQVQLLTVQTHLFVSPTAVLSFFLRVQENGEHHEMTQILIELTKQRDTVSLAADSSHNCLSTFRVVLAKLRV